MFESITKRFTGILGNIAGRKITEKNIRETLREIRVALLEADVALEVIKEFLQKIETEALGEKVLKGVEPGQQFIQVVFQHLVELMGPVDPAINGNQRHIWVIVLRQGLNRHCSEQTETNKDQKDSDSQSHVATLSMTG